jgi:2-phospho-L-lactate/phosphoenolpyruvate guanylyltransferase
MAKRGSHVIVRDAAAREPDAMAPRSDTRAGDGAGIVVPLRSFAHGKARLAAVLDEPARAVLARTMAERVVGAAGARPVVVVSSAPDVVAWASERDLAVIDDPGSLDAAADVGRTWVRARGLGRVVIVHADLPLASSLDAVAGDGATPIAVVVPDHRNDGTPVLSLPAAAPFAFLYGPGSAARHVAEATRCGLDVRVLRDPALGFDVDIEDDLQLLDALRDRSHSRP